MSRKTYQLNVTREGSWWMVDAVDVDYRTQARTRSEAEEMGRDLIAGALGIAADSFDLDIQVTQPAEGPTGQEPASTPTPGKGADARELSCSRSVVSTRITVM